MIPSSVELTNFLSHRSANGEPVTFDFDGAVLWSVAGDNGAGKSASSTRSPGRSTTSTAAGPRTLSGSSPTAPTPLTPPSSS